MSTQILICTLGASWAVIPEIYGWLAPEQLDLYASHPSREQLDALRSEHRLPSPDEIWVCTTGGTQAAKSVELLLAWWYKLERPPALRIWLAEGTEQLATQAECNALRELILRAALKASEISGGAFVASLAGGRKTMSADLQEAAHLFGARAWLHVVGPEPLPSPLRAAQPKLFASPLPIELAAAIQPLVAGVGSRSELLDVPLDGEMLTANRYPLPWPASGEVARWQHDSRSLHEDLQRRREQGSRLLGNFVAGFSLHEHYDNWRSLYRLAPADIERLRTTPLGPEQRGLLDALPKADLHRHLGGSLDLAAQHAVAQAIWDALPVASRAEAHRRIEPLLNQTLWPWNWPETLKSGDRAAQASALLLHASREAVDRALYDSTAPRVALKTAHPAGFTAYERPGELTGSAQLSHPAAIQPYAEALVRQARDEGLAYVELRGSPQKYRPRDPGGFLRELNKALRKASAATSSDDDRSPRFAFLWILDRRQRDGMAAVVEQAVRCREQLSEFLIGLDLAGDEGTHNPRELAAAFAPAFDACMPITIHAGEGESAENIWQAAYHLHADRIGHGLSLPNHSQLAQRFRDRGIALELCPSSNREVVGFADPDHPSSISLPSYPLRRMLELGLPLSLCTDNPGISRTRLGDEFLAAARMAGGLSLWEAIALIRQGFIHAMTSAKERERRLAELETAVLAAVSSWLSLRR